MPRLIEADGFTLIELMIVVAIVGILSAVAIPQYQNYTVRGQVTEGLAMASEFKTAVSEFHSSRGSFPSSNTEAGLGNAAAYTGNYVTNIAVTSVGDINVTYGDRASTALNGLILQLRVGTNDARGVVWACGLASAPSGATMQTATTAATTVLPRFLPADCRA